MMFGFACDETSELGMDFVLSQRGEKRGSVFEPPIIQHKPTLASEQSTALEDQLSSMTSGQLSVNHANFEEEANNIYTECFLIWGSDTIPPKGFEFFKKTLKTLLCDGFSSKEMIEGFKKISFNHSYLCAEIAMGGWHSFLTGPDYYHGTPLPNRSILTQYNCIFGDDDVRKSFVKAFVDCLKAKCTREQIIASLSNLVISEGYWGTIKYHRSITSSEI